MGRWTIAGMLILVATVGVSLAAIREASLVWAAVIPLFIGAFLAFTALMAILSQSYSLAMAAILACNGRGLELPIMPKASENVTLAGLRQAFAEIPIMRALPVHSPLLSAGAARDPA